MKKNGSILIVVFSLVSFILGGSLSYLTFINGKEETSKIETENEVKDSVLTLNGVKYSKEEVLEKVDESVFDFYLNDFIKYEILRLEIGMSNEAIVKEIVETKKLTKEEITNGVINSYLIEKYKLSKDIKEEELKSLYERSNNERLEVKVLSLDNLSESDINDIDKNRLNSNVMSKTESYLFDKGILIEGKYDLKPNSVLKTENLIYVSGDYKKVKYEDVFEDLKFKYINELINSDQWLSEMKNKYGIKFE